MASQEQYHFYWIIPDDRVTAAYGGTAPAAVDAPAVWSLPNAVGDLTWQTPDGPKGNRDIIFGAVADPDGVTVAEWWHRPSWDEVLFGGAQHGPQMGPCTEGGRIEHVASGNVFFLAKTIWPHVPRHMPSSDTAVDGIFRIVGGAINTAQSTMTHLANDDGDYIGRKDWEQSILTEVDAGNLVLLA